MTIEITVPTLGESLTEATVSQWFKQIGDSVDADEPILELETDKVTVEVPAPSAGVLTEILAADGVNVEVGAILGSIAEGEAAPKAEATRAAVAGSRLTMPTAASRRATYLCGRQPRCRHTQSCRPSGPPTRPSGLTNQA